MPFFEKGNVRIHYQEAGSGFPLFINYGGGLNSKLTYANGPFDAVAEFKSEYRCISMDLRNANGGQSTGPLDLENPWNAHTDDQIALLNHLGVDKFFMMGFLHRQSADLEHVAARARPRGRGGVGPAQRR